jgi:LacI family transcriptional regulator
MKQTSMRDIAEELKISITTVSFVLNGKGKEKGISDKTISLVNELIKERGFNPNYSARSLRTGKSNTIVLIVEDISNSFFGNIARIVEQEASKKGFKVVYGSTENDNQKAESLISLMRNSAVEGFIITPTTNLLEELKNLQKQKIPFVLIDRTIPGIESNYVVINNYGGAYDLTSHLIKNGYRKIGFVTISKAMSQMEERRNGYEKALSESGIIASPNWILEIPFEDNSQVIIASIQEYLNKNKDLDALFFATNYLCVNGLEALQNNKMVVPNDIALVSFDDHVLFRLSTPSITVAAQPIEDIASKTIEILLDNIKKGGKPKNPIGVVLQPNLIIRNSSSPKQK